MKFKQSEHLSFGDSISLARGVFNASAMPDAPAIPIESINTESYTKSFQANPVLFWGENNDFPDRLWEVARKAGIARRAAKVMSQLMYDQGILAYREVPTTKGYPTIEVVSDARINDFLERIQVNTYLADSARDYVTYGNVWPVLQLNSKRKIAKIKVPPARYCRLERPNPKTANIENFYISAQWKRGISLQKGKIPENLQGWVQKVKLYQYEDLLALMKTKKSEYNFGLHLKEVSSDSEYGDSPWHSTYYNGWLDIAGSVPELKKRLFLYAMTINYTIYIDDKFWETQFGADWTTKYTAEERDKMVKNVQQSIEDNLLGKENAFKTIFSNIRYMADGKERKAIIIEAIDNKLREGTFIPDNLHANSEIVAAFGVDRSLFGATVFGEKVNSGSGSPIREARNNTIAMMELDRQLLLQPLRVAHLYEGLPSDIKYGFKAFIINRLDGRDEGQTTTATTQ